MTSLARILDGKLLASEIRAEIKKDVQAYVQKAGLPTGQAGSPPGLASILVGDNPASHTYVANKIKACKEVGIASFHHPLPAHASPEDIKALIRKLNEDAKVHGILLQLPLPGGLDSTPLLEAIHPDKDADGLHPFNLGQLFQYKTWAEMVAGQHPLSCTPYGVIQILQRSHLPVAGKHAVIIGRSKLVGKPLAMMLLAQNATVTLCHSGTRHLDVLCGQADILVTAMGQPRFLKAPMVKEGAVVIDVGINRGPDGTLCGDVDFEPVRAKASAITPVPGGVGPLTVTMLLHNTLQLAKKTCNK